MLTPPTARRNGAYGACVRGDVSTLRIWPVQPRAEPLFRSRPQITYGNMCTYIRTAVGTEFAVACYQVQEFGIARYIWRFALSRFHGTSHRCRSLAFVSNCAMYQVEGCLRKG
jgi:hypothetical protein